MIVLFGLGTRLHVRMRTKLENGILRIGHRPQTPPSHEEKWSGEPSRASARFCDIVT